MVVLAPWKMNESVAIENQKTKNEQIPQISKNSNQASLFSNPIGVHANVDASLEHNNKARTSGRAVTEFERSQDVKLVDCEPCFKKWLETLPTVDLIPGKEIEELRSVIGTRPDLVAKLAPLLFEAIPPKVGYQIAALLAAEGGVESLNSINDAIRKAHDKNDLFYRGELLFALHDIDSTKGVLNLINLYNQLKVEGATSEIIQSYEQVMGELASHTPHLIANALETANLNHQSIDTQAMPFLLPQEASKR